MPTTGTEQNGWRARRSEAYQINASIAVGNAARRVGELPCVTSAHNEEGRGGRGNPKFG